MIIQQFCNNNLLVFLSQNRSLTNPIFDVSAEVSVGKHLYWQLGSYQVHGQVLITSWVVLSLIAILALAGNTDLKMKP